jgi:hypothetical protein
LSTTMKSDIDAAIKSGALKNAGSMTPNQLEDWINTNWY